MDKATIMTLQPLPKNQLCQCQHYLFQTCELKLSNLLSLDAIVRAFSGRRILALASNNFCGRDIESLIVKFPEMYIWVLYEA